MAAGFEVRIGGYRVARAWSLEKARQRAIALAFQQSELPAAQRVAIEVWGGGECLSQIGPCVTDEDE